MQIDMPVHTPLPDDSQDPRAAAPEPAEAPILSLEEARARRAAAAQSAGHPASAPSPAEALGDALQAGRLRLADLLNMVRLGIMTDRHDLLPCRDPHRRTNAMDWEHHYQSGAPPPPPSQVSCPLLSQVASPGAPACVEALRAQAHVPLYQLGRGFVRRVPDADDPVVRSDLRPCLLLSRVLLRQILPTG